MKALKYGLTLMLGLSMGLGVQAFAQASGQTAEVVPNNPNTLPEVAPAAGQQVQQAEEQPQRGVPTPKAIENLVDQKEYTKAVEEFEKFIKTAKGNPCDLTYLRMSFYDRLVMEDTANAKTHQAKRDGLIKELEGKCAQMPDLYVLKARFDSDQSPESTIRWMTKAIEADQSYGMCYAMRGDAYWTLNQTEKACADYKKAAELKDQVGIMFYDQRCGAGQAAE